MADNLRRAIAFSVPLGEGLHLIGEPKPMVAYDLLMRRLEEGSVALLITREHPDRVARERDIGTSVHYWLSMKKLANSLHPGNLRKMQRTLDDFLRKHPGGTVFLDGIELLYQENGYARVRGFLDKLQSIASSRSGAAIIPFDCRVFGAARTSEMRGRYTVIEARPSR